ncbi:hypothetical protein V2J09_019580 [Rumex salicifolius]
MDVAKIVEFTRDYATMVRVKGPDPRGLKMKNHAFHNYNSGITTLSASGMLLPDNLRILTNFGDSKNFAPGCAVVVSVASIVEPFMAVKTKEANVQAQPELIPHAQIDVMIEQRGLMKQNVEGENNHEAQWFPAKILRLVDVPTSSSAVKLLMEASSPSLEHSWEVGWSLGSNVNHPKYNQEKVNFISSKKSGTLPLKSRQQDLIGKAITRIVFLQLPDIQKDLAKIITSPSCNRGDLLITMGSPFGILSPAHFFNSVSTGFIANCYPPASDERSLLMADIHCLPGMEGAPIFDQQSNLIGLLTRPLRQNGGAEIQLVVPWKAIEAACRDSCQLVCQSEGKEVLSDKENFDNTCMALMQSSDRILSSTSIKKQLRSCSASSVVEQAMASVCLVAVGSGVWATGIVLNSVGLILTNAHLLEPWRFGSRTVTSGHDEKKAEELAIFFKDSKTSRSNRVSEYHKPEILQPNTTSLDHLYKGHVSHPAFRGARQISVRLDHVDPWIWCPAKVVYVCQGTLDIALLMLESFPTQLCPIKVDLNYPTQGSKACVIGHGLFGPRCGLYPSVSSGVVAQIVKSGIAPVSSLASENNPCSELPVMIQTTAAVHPGSSGGAVVNSTGHMIGIVTSIPCTAMEPIFKFATDMKNVSLLDELDKPNKGISSVWSMMPPLPDEQGPSIPGVQDLLKKDRQGKGSRFAKFIAEREELIKKSKQVKTTGSLLRDTISKL